MKNKSAEETSLVAYLPIIFRFNTQERKVILPYLLSRCQCKGNLSVNLLRAVQIAYEHESSLDGCARAA